MLSHEPKNYALLAYDGSLLFRFKLAAHKEDRPRPVYALIV